MQTQFDRDIYACHNCHVWDPDNQPSVQRELERDPSAYVERIFMTIENGMTLDVGDGLRIPLSTELVLCEPHARRCVELYGPPRPAVG